MKHGAWTPCLECGHTPESLEDRAKHVMTSDHHFSQADLEGIADRVKRGEPLRFDPQQVETYAAGLKDTDASFRKIGLFVAGVLVAIVLGIVGVIYWFK